MLTTFILLVLQAAPAPPWAPYASYRDAIEHGVVFEPPPPPPPPDPAIRTVIEASASDWNRGDLDGFMRSYEDSPQTAMLTPKGPVRGWRTLRDRYHARYAGKAAAGLGRLSFTDLEVRALDADWALAYGRFHLVQDPAKPEQTGVFDLLMHRTPQGWRIASDHTS